MTRRGQLIKEYKSEIRFLKKRKAEGTKTIVFGVPGPAHLNVEPYPAMDIDACIAGWEAGLAILESHTVINLDDYEF